MSLDIEDRVILDGEVVEDYDVTGEERDAYLRQLRGLVESGGDPYIRIVFDTATSQAHVDAAGVEPADIPATLREVADLLTEQLQ